MNGGALNILFVEDDAADADIVNTFFFRKYKNAYTWTHVSTLREALDALGQESYDAILLDLNLPDSSGIDTVQVILKAKQQPPIVVMSGYADDDIAKLAVRDGAQDYINKQEIPRADLKQKIAYAIERQKLVHELKVARNEAAEANEAKSIFLATMSHEIRTPMNDVTYDMDSSGINQEDVNRNIRILLVEDNDVNEKIAVKFLEKLKYRVDVVRCAEGALEALNRTSYDLVLMDVQMPGVDGYQATQMIRQSNVKELRNIPIIAMTANAIDRDREKCFECGMNDFLSKPIGVETLKKTLEKWVGPSRKAAIDSSADSSEVHSDSGNNPRRIA